MQNPVRRKRPRKKKVHPTLLHYTRAVDPDPAVFLNADPDADPDPEPAVQNLQKITL